MLRNYRNKKLIEKKLRLLIRESVNQIIKEEDYITHFNGGRPFSVHKSDNFLYVFKNAFHTHDNVLKIFNGDKEDDNSSILVKLAARDKNKSKDKDDELYYKELKHKYLFVGEEVYSFETDDEIVKYYSLIGNSDVAYPVALSKKNAYFMLDKQYVDRAEFPKDTDWKNGYQYFYGHEDFENKDKLKKKKFENFKIIEKNPLRENKIRLIVRKSINQIIKEEIVNKKLGSFGLDSGQAIIIDPAHLDNYKKDIDKMNSGDFRGGKNQSKDFGAALYLSLFGGDGTFDVYGVYDTDGEFSHMPYKLVVHIKHPDDFPEEIKLFEGTSNYYPGYSDDGTADTLSTIRDKTSPIVNKELKKLSKELLKDFSSVVESEEEGGFWQKWLIANLITTSLQDGFFIDPELIKTAKEYYKEVLNHPNKKGYLSDSLKTFDEQVGETLEALKQEEKLGGGKQKKYYYAPGFMNRDRRKYKWN